MPSLFFSLSHTNTHQKFKKDVIKLMALSTYPRMNSGTQEVAGESVTPPVTRVGNALKGESGFPLRAKFKSWCSSSGICPEVWFPNCNRNPYSQNQECTQNAPSFQPAGPASSFPFTQVGSTAAHGSRIKHQVGTSGRWVTMEGEADHSVPLFLTSLNLGTTWDPITGLFSLSRFSFAK